MLKIMDKMGYKNDFEPTGIVVKCEGNGKHNGEVGTAYSNGDTLYIKFGGIYVKVDGLKERGYTLTAFQKWAQSAF